jgi:WD40 repeat protein
LFVSLRSGTVTAVKFASENIVASSSEDGSTKFWDLGTGQETAKAVPEGLTFPKQGGAEDQRINSYVVAAKGKTLCIFKAADCKAETAETAPMVETAEAEETAAVAFFQCASKIQAFDVSELERSHIAVCCADGQVLQLRAAVLLT